MDGGTCSGRCAWLKAEGRHAWLGGGGGWWGRAWLKRKGRAWLDRMIDACKNINFLQLRWRAVNISFEPPFNEVYDS